ncbi:hypothetical protein ACHRV6_17985 [Flavobacterium sp. FlaQc-51]|jgi:HTH-type transcriptional regulator/antitoxin HipB|nr:hypothetical protein [Flavobacterium sp. Leaf82]
MKTYTLDQVTDEVIGKIGTPNRDKFESELQLELLNLNDLLIAKKSE